MFSQRWQLPTLDLQPRQPTLLTSSSKISDDKLKIRDSANGQHIDLFTFNQTDKTVTTVAGAEDPTAIAIALG